MLGMRRYPQAVWQAPQWRSRKVRCWHALATALPGPSWRTQACWATRPDDAIRHLALGQYHARYQNRDWRLTRAGLRAATREGADAKGRHLIRPSPTRTTQGWSCLPLVSYLGNRGFLQDSKLRVARGVRAG